MVENIVELSPPPSRFDILHCCLRHERIIKQEIVNGARQNFGCNMNHE